MLLIDNELKKREIDWRHWQICRALHHFPEDGDMKVVSRRGKSCDINLVADRILQMDLTGVVLIVIDAIYKAIPDGKSENDNEAMGKLMNTLQNIAERTGIAVVCVHHATKGDQSHKSTLDILAGAGSFGRSLDAMIAVRDHEQEGLNVIEFRSRTNPDPEPISAKFAFPLWESVTVAPAVKKPKLAGEAAQAKRDKEAKEKVAAKLSTTEWLSNRQLRRLTGLGETRVDKGLAMLDGQVKHKRVRRNGKPVDVTKVVVHESGPSNFVDQCGPWTRWSTRLYVIGVDHWSSCVKRSLAKCVISIPVLTAQARCASTAHGPRASFVRAI